MKYPIHQAQIGAALVVYIAILTGCASTPERRPLPANLIDKVTIPGIPEARFWADEWPTFSVKRLNSLNETNFKKDFSATYNTVHNYLAISGGGANGAFGAGLLAGWAAQGTRPEFTMITGVSTGALTAPFTFLGADYDPELKTIYTTTWTKDVALEKNVVNILRGDSLSDTAPLKQLIRQYMTPKVVEAIAQEHKKGRRLFLGTVNLDASRSVIWNIGAIAASTHPKKVELIHDIMRASAAIPVAFPPVIITVEADGQQYDEMHVDGSVSSQVFVYPAAIDWKAITQKLKVKGKPNIFVIRNAFLKPDYNGVNRSVLSIATRSIDTLLRSSGTGDLYQIYALCRRDNNEFNLAYIPADFTEEPTEGFDPVYMSKLYKRGYDMAYKGYPWENGPPGFVTSIEGSNTAE